MRAEQISSDSAISLAEKIERKNRLIKSVSSKIKDARDCNLVKHSYEKILKQRVFLMMQGYEDANDVEHLKNDPILKSVLEGDLASQPTVFRFENSIDKQTILVAVGGFRASGALEILINGIEYCFSLFGVNTDFVAALPTAFMKPLSGGGAEGIMNETLKIHGVDSFVGKLSSTFLGATDTTFYIIAVYFGSVGIRNTRYAVTCGLIADFSGITAAILIGYLFYH